MLDINKDLHVFDIKCFVLVRDNALKQAKKSSHNIIYHMD